LLYKAISAIFSAWQWESIQDVETAKGGYALSSQYKVAKQRRTAHAKEAAKGLFRSVGYDIFNSDNQVYCFTASIGGIFERKVRVVVDKISQEDKDLVEKLRIQSTQTKEIWCRPYNSREWERVILNSQNESIGPLFQ